MIDARAFLAFPAAETWNPTFRRNQVEWVARQVKPVAPLATLLARGYADTARQHDYVQANLELASITRELRRHDLNLSWTDDELCRWCEHRAKKALPWLREAETTDQPEQIAAVIERAAELVGRYGIELADVEEHGPLPVLRRLTDARWWRLKVRKLQAREVERVAILLRRVRKGREIYCSDETVRRRSAQRWRNRKYLEATKAVNLTSEPDERTGERQTYTLAQLADLSTSNPKIKRVELMVRVRGFDEVAQQLGHVREFWTLTAPSRFHRWATAGDRRKKANPTSPAMVRENPAWDGSMPWDAQRWLCAAWSRIRAALARHGVRLYGFRVVEAHHDGTPHWHAAMFYSPHWQRPLFDAEGELIGFDPDTTRAAAPRVRAIVRRYMAEEERKAAKEARRAHDRAERRRERAREKAERLQAKADASTERAVKTRQAAADAWAAFRAARDLADAAGKLQRRTARTLQEREAHGFDAKAIDPAKGDAAGYLAKYITKAIESGEAGELVQEDLYGYDAGQSAKRVDAWASATRTRQFQQIGGPSVTTWREVRRAMGREATQGDLFNAPKVVQLAAEAADESDWRAFVLLMGGPTVRRQDQLMRLDYRAPHDPETGELIGAPLNRYGEDPAARVYGLSYHAETGEAVTVRTRLNVWAIKRPGEERPALGECAEFAREAEDTRREIAATAEWLPWAFDVLEREAEAGPGAWFFMGGAAAPPLESCL